MLAESLGAREHYDERQAAGDHHNAALRDLANKLLGRLWWCLAHNQLWDDDAGLATPNRTPKSGRRLTTHSRGMSMFVKRLW